MNHKATIIKVYPKKEKQFSLTRPLLHILGDPWTIGDACEGVQIFGGTGSGKTSGSGQTLAKVYLDNNFGGLVLTVKAGDRIMWEDYCENRRRESDLIIVNESGKYKFNFLHYLVEKGYNTVNITHIFLSALQKTNQGDYWQNAMEQLIKNTINLLVIGTGSVSIQNMYKVVVNAPKTLEESLGLKNLGCGKVEDNEQKKDVNSSLETGSQIQSEYFSELFQAAKLKIAKLKVELQANLKNTNPAGNIGKDKDTFEDSVQNLDPKTSLTSSQITKLQDKINEFEMLTTTYWQLEFPNMDPEPRSSIISMFTSLADNLLRGEMRSILSCEPSEMNFYPEDTFGGKIIVLDLNIKQFRETGKMAQLIFKTIFQMAIERDRENIESTLNLNYLESEGDDESKKSIERIEYERLLKVKTDALTTIDVEVVESERVKDKVKEDKTESISVSKIQEDFDKGILKLKKSIKAKHQANIELQRLNMRPVFLWIDEAQFFLTKDDVMFQTTARSSKVCSVYLTQNYSNYLAFVVSNREKATVDSFLAVLQTKFFHCQSDPITNNEYVSKLIGKEYIERLSHNESHGDNSHYSKTTNYTLDYKILPWELDQLAKGGANNNDRVEAFVYQSGRIWKATKTNYGLVMFKQNHGVEGDGLEEGEEIVDSGGNVDFVGNTTAPLTNA